MKNAPQTIFLQVGEDLTPDEDFNELHRDCVTWHEERIFPTDLEFIAPDQYAVYTQTNACNFAEWVVIEWEYLPISKKWYYKPDNNELMKTTSQLYEQFLKERE